jgi:hypothetical protein
LTVWVPGGVDFGFRGPSWLDSWFGVSGRLDFGLPFRIGWIFVFVVSGVLDVCCVASGGLDFWFAVSGWLVFLFGVPGWLFFVLGSPARWVWKWLCRVGSDVGGLLVWPPVGWICWVQDGLGVCVRSLVRWMFWCAASVGLDLLFVVPGGSNFWFGVLGWLDFCLGLGSAGCSFAVPGRLDLCVCGLWCFGCLVCGLGWVGLLVCGLGWAGFLVWGLRLVGLLGWGVGLVGFFVWGLGLVGFLVWGLGWAGFWMVLSAGFAVGRVVGVWPLVGWIFRGPGWAGNLVCGLWYVGGFLVCGLGWVGFVVCGLGWVGFLVWGAGLVGFLFWCLGSVGFFDCCAGLSFSRLVGGKAESLFTTSSPCPNT